MVRICPITQHADKVGQESELMPSSGDTSVGSTRQEAPKSEVEYVLAAKSEAWHVPVVAHVTAEYVVPAVEAATRQENPVVVVTTTTAPAAMQRLGAGQDTASRVAAVPDATAVQLAPPSEVTTIAPPSPTAAHHDGFAHEMP
jgi:hypothetical protein